MNKQRKQAYAVVQKIASDDTITANSLHESVRDLEVRQCCACNEELNHWVLQYWHSVLANRHHCRLCQDTVCSACAVKKSSSIINPKTKFEILMCPFCSDELPRLLSEQNLIGSA